MIAEAIIQLLHSLAALVAIVGDRISPNVIVVSEETPAVYVLDDNMRELDCDESNSQYYGTVEIGIHSHDYAECAAGMKVIREYMKNYNGEIVMYSDGSRIGMKVASYETTQDGYVEDDATHVKAMTFEVFAKIKS